MNPDIEGLDYLQWSLFDSPDQPGSGYRFMERYPAKILDDIVKQNRFVLDINLGYVSKAYGDKMSLPTRDSHRIGRAIRIRILNPKKRYKLVSGLIMRGVKRIAVSRDEVYFDTDSLKPPMFALW
jgi:hypothetical protein